MPILREEFEFESLRVSPENPFDWKFLKVGSVIVYSFIKASPPRALTVKGVVCRKL